MDYQTIPSEELTEEFIQKEKIRTQKILCPINISFVGIDSKSKTSKNKIITLSPFWEKLLDIQKMSPEENLKKYKYPILLSKILLIIAFFCSSIVPFIFIEFNNYKSISFKNVIYWIFWYNFLILIFFSIGFLNQAKKTKLGINYFFYYYKKRITKKELKKSIFDSLLYFFYLLILLKNCNFLENIIICNTQVISLLLRFVFKIGRNVSFNINILKSLIIILIGILLSLFFFNKEDNIIFRQIMNIVAALLGGTFWLCNREINSTLFLKLRYFLIIVNLMIFSFFFSFFFFGFGDFLDFFIDNFFFILCFSSFLSISTVLKLLLANLYEEIILSLIFCFESFFIFIIMEIKKELIFGKFESVFKFLENFVALFILKSLFIFFF